MADRYNISTVIDPFETTISTTATDALLGYRVFRTRICTNLFSEYKLLEHWQLLGVYDPYEQV